MRVKKPGILKNFNGVRRCEWCGRLRRCEAAHIFAKGMGGGGRLDVAINLIALCNPGGCHDRSEDCTIRRGKRQRRIKRAEVIRRLLWYIVGRREGIDSHAIEDEIYRLRRTPAGTREGKVGRQSTNGDSDAEVRSGSHDDVHRGADRADDPADETGWRDL